MRKLKSLPLSVTTLALALTVGACGSSSETAATSATTETATSAVTPTPPTSAPPCETCIAGGGTWQPEASECTEDCGIQDISCFRDECPGACADNCEHCFSVADCEGAGCTWHALDEATWCTAAP